MPNKLLLTILSGLLLGLSWPVSGFAPLLFVGFVPMLCLINSSKTEHFWPFFVKVFIGFLTWNAIATWWLWNATVFGMFFAMTVNSVLMALIIILWRRVNRTLGEKSALIFLPLAWISFEKMHLGWDFSWPWLNLGNGFAAYPNWIQWYEYTGSFGGTLWIWVVNIMVYKVFVRFNKSKRMGFAWIQPVLVILIPILLSFYIRLSYEAEDNAPFNVTVVQPNIDPYKDKYSLTNQELYTDLIALITPELSKNPHLIVTPETYFSEGAGTFLPTFDQNTLYTKMLGFSSKNNTQFLNGIQFYNTYGDINKTETANKIKNGVWADFYNSAFLTDTTELRVYHKSKLVVGVETLPYRNIIEPLLGNVMLDFGGTLFVRATQKERAAFKLYNGDRVGPIICYESVYGEFVNEYVRKGATVLAIMTNDAWWGNTPGHKQHLAYASLRAIETRRPIVRSANTGISGFINPLGEIKGTLPYNSKGVLTATVIPQTKQTLYVRFGDYIFRIGAFLSAFILIFTFARKKN